MSNLINKAKAALHSDKSSDTHHDNPHSTNAGPHSSNVANTVDPRVDSDRDGRNDPTSRTGGYGQTQTGTTGIHDQTTTGGYGTSGTHGTTGGYGSSNTAGPHSSNMANKVDPRVDSDLDGSRTAGGYGNTGNTGYGTTGTHGTSGGYGSSNTAGPHSSSLANKVDPRVDSDLDGSRTAGGNAGYGNTGTHGTAGGYGTSGTHGTTGGYGSSNAGPHSSNVANTVDPRVDSDRDGSRTVGGAGAGYGSTTGTHGTSHNTHGTGHNVAEHASAGSGKSTNAGPHNSNLLNKLDPRVDSDQSGGKTYGGNATYQ